MIKAIELERRITKSLPSILAPALIVLQTTVSAVLQSLIAEKSREINIDRQLRTDDEYLFAISQPELQLLFLLDFFGLDCGISPGLIKSRMGAPSASEKLSPRMAAAEGAMSIIRATAIFAPGRAPAP